MGLLATLGVAAWRGATLSGMTWEPVGCAPPRSACLNRGDRQVLVRESLDVPGDRGHGDLPQARRPAPASSTPTSTREVMPPSPPPPPSSIIPALPLSTLPPVHMCIGIGVGASAEDFVVRLVSMRLRYLSFWPLLHTIVGLLRQTLHPPRLFPFHTAPRLSSLLPRSTPHLILWQKSASKKPGPDVLSR